MSDAVMIHCTVTAWNEVGGIPGCAGVAPSERRRRAGEGMDEHRP